MNILKTQGHNPVHTGQAFRLNDSQRQATSTCHNPVHTGQAFRPQQSLSLPLSGKDFKGNF